MPRWTLPVVAFVTVVLLGAGIVAVVTAEPEQAASKPTGTSTTSTAAVATSTTEEPASSTTTSAVSADDIESVVPAVEAFVEKERGLKFDKPTTVTLLADEDFEARATEVDDKDLAEIKHAEEALKAMGLLDHGADLAAIVRSFTAGAVLGFYDPKTKELVVRGARPTPYVRSTLAHELTHALEDQHFGLERDNLGDEASFGFEGLVEGSAVRIEKLYRQSLSKADQRQADQEEQERGGEVPNVPEVVQFVFGFPYFYGPDLVAAILKAGGQTKLDAAYTDPPASTEQVLIPRRYLEGDKPKPVTKPVADGKVTDDGEIGQLFLALMLRAELSANVARTASEGWGGDHYVAWNEKGRTCMRMAFVMDTPADTAQLTEALTAWAAKRPGDAVATGTSLRTCG